MIVIFAEKPDVGRKIAAALDVITLNDGKKVSYEELSRNENAIKSQQSKDGYLKINFKGETTYVTWGYGHLCELKSAKDYDPCYQQWRNLPVPFIPQPYEIKIKDSTQRQFNVVKGLVEKSSLVINATDFDKEGEVIFFYLMKAMRINKPFKRAHFSSMEKDAFIQAFNNLKGPESVENATNAGRSRSIADWVVGCNLTVAMSLKYSGNSVLSIGRVQTPTLNMLVERELAIRNFKPETYYLVKAIFETDNHEKYEAISVRKRITDKEDAEAVYRYLIGKTGTVKSVESEDEYKSPPPLYNLVRLQMDANNKYGLTLSQTLEVAQSLYEGGYTTYPRTDSQYLTEDMEPAVNNVLDALAKSSTEYGKLINGKPRNINRKRYFDNSKVESHYAIIPTANVPTSLTGVQQKIYDLIARSVIMMIYPSARLKKTKVVTSVESEDFDSVGSVVVSPGWMDVDKKPDEKILPDLKVGQTVSGEYSLDEKLTEPPKRYTDASLVSAMASAGKELDDAELRKVMASGDKGIGTEATRHSIPETLIERNYAERKGKHILPTEKGIALIQSLPLKEIKSAELTAIWEKRLDDIANGKEQMDTFLKDIEKATVNWCDEIQRSDKNDAISAAGSHGLKCPGCGNHLVRQKWGYGCSNYKNGCKFAIGDTVASKKLTDAQIESLIKDGTTGLKPISGFTSSKSGKKFSAILTFTFEITNGLVSECKMAFAFPETSSPAQGSRSKVSSDLRCPSCGGTITNGKWSWECSEGCGFSFSYKIAGRDMRETDLVNLITKGRTGELNGFMSKSGKYFAAAMKLKNDKKGAEFVFDNKSSKKSS